MNFSYTDLQPADSIIDFKRVTHLPYEYGIINDAAEPQYELVEEFLPTGADLSEPVTARNELDTETADEKDSSLRVHIKRGALTASIGNTLLVGTAVMNGYDKRETSKVNVLGSLDGAALLFPLITGIAEGISQGAKHGYAE